MPKAKKSKTERGAAIVGLRIRKLFGYFDYEIEPPATESAFTKLIIFYGLNGTGKTTILRLIFHLLSPKDKVGHKSFIAQTPFQLFEVTLSNGTCVSASRRNPTDGTFTLAMSRPKSKTLEYELRTIDSPRGIALEPSPTRPYYEILEDLRQLGFAFYYLADDRTFTVESDAFPRRRPLDYDLIEERRPFYRRIREPEERESIVEALQETMHSFNSWVSRRASYHSSTGVASTHSVYADVIKRIVTRGKPGPQIKRPALAEQIDELRAIASESSVFEKYGLSSRLDVRPLIQIIQRAPQRRRPIARDVLTPYLEALNLRFEQLRPLYALIDTLITDLNRYLDPKSVSFSVQDGLLIFSPTGARLEPEMLSSGEKHLLLITCGACLATASRGLFIVDEPEISLNIVWQRTLLDTLLEISRGSQVQFLLASHSIALIAQHRAHVARLVSDKGE